MALAAEGAGIGLFAGLGAGGSLCDRFRLRMLVVGIDGAADGAYAVFVGMVGNIAAVDPLAAVFLQRAGVAAGAAADIFAFGQGKSKGQGIAVAEEVFRHSPARVGPVDAVHPASFPSIVKFAYAVETNLHFRWSYHQAVQLQQALQFFRDFRIFKSHISADPTKIESVIQRAGIGYIIAQALQHFLHRIGGGDILKDIRADRCLNNAQSQHRQIQPHRSGADLLTLLTCLIINEVLHVFGVALAIPHQNGHDMARIAANTACFQMQIVLQTTGTRTGTVLDLFTVQHYGDVILMDRVIRPIGSPDGKSQIAVGCFQPHF